jgi:hypothetical protein
MHLQKVINNKNQQLQQKIQINNNRLSQVYLQFYSFFFNFVLFFYISVEKQTSTNSIYVGQLPENVEESDIKKLFPKSTKIELIPSKTTPKGVRAAFAFVTFPDDNLAAAAIKLGPSLKLKNTQLKVAYQTKRAT